MRLLKAVLVTLACSAPPATEPARVPCPTLGEVFYETEGFSDAERGAIAEGARRVEALCLDAREVSNEVGGDLVVRRIATDGMCDAAGSFTPATSEIVLVPDCTDDLARAAAHEFAHVAVLPLLVHADEAWGPSLLSTTATSPVPTGIDAALWCGAHPDLCRLVVEGSLDPGRVGDCSP